MRQMPGQHDASRMPADIREALHNCHEMCQETAQYCLEMGGKHAEADHIRLLLDCAEMCQTAEDFLTRGSPQFAAVASACAEICEQCAEACSRFPDDNQMRACAEVCRSCAELCRQVQRRAA